MLPKTRPRPTCHALVEFDTSDWGPVFVELQGDNTYSNVSVGNNLCEDWEKYPCMGVISNIEYFGEPIYTYSLRQGISDGFLAPYKVVRIGLDKDLDGWRPEIGQTDRHGQVIETRGPSIILVILESLGGLKAHFPRSCNSAGRFPRARAATLSEFHPNIG